MATEGRPGAKRAEDLSGQYRDAAGAIRERTDTTVKALGAVGTAAVTGLGYAELADFFPFGGPWGMWAVAILGVVVMVGALLMFLRRFQGVGESIVTTSDPTRTAELNGLKPEEVQKLESIYLQTASLNGVETLRAYLARAHRFERLADRADKDRAAELRQRADLIQVEVKATKDRATMVLVRERARAALFARTTALWLLLFVGGWYLTAVAADAMESKRSEGVELKTKCVELREKGGDKPLPGICGELPKKSNGTSKGSASPAKVVREGLPAISKLWADCLTIADEAGKDGSACAPLQRALEAVHPVPSR
jgi:hypothetical protein